MNNSMRLPVPLKSWGLMEAVFPGNVPGEGSAALVGSDLIPGRGVHMPQGFPNNERRTFVLEY